MLLSHVDAAFARDKYTRSAIESAKSALAVEVFRKQGDSREWMRLPERTEEAAYEQDEEAMEV
jgi:hypothetical protein